MSHNTIVVDTDARFHIDAVTREIKNLSTSVKNKVIQYDHNSERIGFSMPRYIEGHDMTSCNRVEIHYRNMDTTTKEETAGVYEVSDVEIDTTDDTQITFSWLVSQNATQKVGLLLFLVRFACVSEDSTIEYAWNTAKFSGICVSEGMYNSDEIVEQYADVLEQWRRGTIFKVFCSDIGEIGKPSSYKIISESTFKEMEQADVEGRIVMVEYSGNHYWLDRIGIDCIYFSGVIANESHTLTCTDENVWSHKTYYLCSEEPASKSYVEETLNNATPGIVNEVIASLPNADTMSFPLEEAVSEVSAE